ncbi:MAG: penicillin-binding protein, partial [Polaromonas sp.]|nr:penicillin-binding protein [Polaromonas sp.]
LAQAMGVRQSKLEQVPSLALGTSPVTLKEMVSAYSTIANSGSYIEPMLVTRIEDRNGRVLEKFQAKAPEQALSIDSAQTLLDVMRGVIDRGTGVGIRTRFGIRADVAGKTGTTQDNTDGWFILMHPQLVAGAWVGFNDNRITMQSDYWGQGAHSALPIVGDFFQRSLRSRVVNQRARFDAPREVRAPAPMPVEAPEAEAVLSLEAAWPSIPAAQPEFVPETDPVVPRIITIAQPASGFPQAERVPQILSVPVARLPQAATWQAPENIGNGQ